MATNSIIIFGIILGITLVIIVLNKKLNHIFRGLCMIFLTVSLMELFIFNISSFRLIGGKYETENFNIDNLKLDGIEYNSETQVFTITSSKNSSIELLDINKAVGTINVDLSGIEIYDVTVEYADETCKDYAFNIPKKTMVNCIERSKYIPCLFSGNVSKLKINLEGMSKGTEFKINKIVLNEQIPIIFNIVRYLTILIFCICCYLLLKLKIFSMPYNKNSKIQNAIFIGLIVLLSASDLLVIKNNELKDFNVSYGYSHLLVDSIIEKKPYLDYKVDDSLKNLEDPYDTSERQNVKYLWDFAYYNGKYYLYFGIVPAILIFTPYKLITGQYISVVQVGKIFAILFTIFLCLLIKRICMKYFKNIPYKILIMCCVMAHFGSLVLWLCSRLMLYEFIILSSITFSVIGLYFYFLATKDEENINHLQLFICCTCLALAVGCRPTTLLVSFIIVPKLLSIFIKKCKEKDKKSIINMIVAVRITIYNYW